MALFGSSRDISMFRKINRELMGDIITQQCAIYKFRIDSTPVNIYGEANEEKYYEGPVLVNCLVERPDPSYNETDLGPDYKRQVNFRFFRDDLVDINLLLEVGDIFLYRDLYFEVHNVIDNQFFVGKDPSYPNESNPLNPGLGEFGSNISIICSTHQIPADRVGITKERYNG
jgi:hypothetical protein